MKICYCDLERRRIVVVEEERRRGRMSEAEVSSGADSGYEVGEPQANQNRVWLPMWVP
jgi:hypothetical protein